MIFAAETCTVSVGKRKLASAIEVTYSRPRIYLPILG